MWDEIRGPYRRDGETWLFYHENCPSWASSSKGHFFRMDRWYDLLVGNYFLYRQEPANPLYIYPIEHHYVLELIAKLINLMAGQCRALL